MLHTEKIPLHLTQNEVYKLSCSEESCSQSYIGKSSSCLEHRVKEHSRHVSSTVYIPSESNNQIHANTSHFKVINYDGKQVTRQARETIHIRINNPTPIHNRGKMYIPEIIKSLLEADKPSEGSVQMADSNLPQGHKHLNIPSNRFSREVCLANKPV